MKKLLLLVILLCSINVFGQNTASLPYWPLLLKQSFISNNDSVAVWNHSTLKYQKMRWSDIGGMVTSISIATANGFNGISSGGTTPTITLGTPLTGIIKGNGSSFSAAIPGTDYVTSSSTNTFTNKSGNISQWTNDANYGVGTVTSVSVTSANGVSGTVATATTTPAITLSLGAITPTSIVASGTISASNFSGSSTGPNTGDQTTITGNAATATALQTGRTINGTTFDGTSNITITAAPSGSAGGDLSGTYPNPMAVWANGYSTYNIKYAYKLNPVLKTTTYSAVAGDFVACDNTSGSFTVTLPSAPADGTRIGVKMVIQSSTNTITVNASGSDVFNKTGGGTAFTISLINQGAQFQYLASTGTWYIMSCDFSLASLDTRYYSATNPSSFIARTGLSASKGIVYNSSTGNSTIDSTTVPFFYAGLSGTRNSTTTLCGDGVFRTGSSGTSVLSNYTSSHGLIYNNDSIKVAIGKLDARSFDAKVVPINTGSIAVGTSIMTGFNTTESYFAALTRITGVTTTNLAVSSTGSRYANYTYNLNKPGTSLTAVFCDAGFNNVRVTSASKAVRYQTVSAGYRSLAARTWLSAQPQFIYSGTIANTLNANVTLSTPAGWTSGVSSGAGSFNDYGSICLYYRANVASQSACSFIKKTSVTTNETLTYTGLTGSQIAIGTWGTDGTTNNWSRFTVTIDGTLLTQYNGITASSYNPNGNAYTGFTDGSQQTTDGLMNDAIIITNLTNTSHTIIITFLDSGKPTGIDYIGTLVSPFVATSAPFYIMDMYHMSTASGIGYNTSGQITTKAIIDSASAYIRTAMMQALPGYPFAFVPTNLFYSPETDVTFINTNTDGVHPLKGGDMQILQGVMTVVNQIGNESNLTINYLPMTTGSYAQSNTTLFQTLNSGSNTMITNQAVSGFGTAVYVARDEGTNNQAFFGLNTDNASFGVNRMLGSGTFINTGKGAAQLNMTGDATGGYFQFLTASAVNTVPSVTMYLNKSGRLFIGGSTSATANLHLAAGTATASTAPLKFTSGTNLTTTEAGAIEYDGTNITIANTASGPRLPLIGGTLNYVHTIFTPSTGGSITLIDNQYNIVNPSGAILALTVTLPSSPNNNDVVYIKYTQGVTTVTYAGGTIADAITAPTAGQIVMFVYDSGTSTWY